MKLEKATSEDIEHIWEFLSMIDEVNMFGTYTHYTDGLVEKINGERFKDLVSQFFEGDFVNPKPSLSSAFYKVILGYQTLVENCCDPELNYLEWHPDLKKNLDEQLRIYNNKLNEQSIQSYTNNSTEASKS
jgi:hypothetical protein